MTWPATAAAVAVAFIVGGAACSSTSDDASSPATGGAGADRVTLRIPASTQSGGYPTPYAAIRGPGRLVSTYLFDTLAFPDVTGEPKHDDLESTSVLPNRSGPAPTVDRRVQLPSVTFATNTNTPPRGRPEPRWVRVSVIETRTPPALGV